MKKLFTLLAGILVSIFSFGQVTTSPASFTAEDEVTVTVDVSGTDMAGQTEAYIWAWTVINGVTVNAVTNSGSSDWTNSPEAAKMTAAGTNKWSFKLTGTLLFGKSPGELKSFRFLVKTKNGSKQTQGDDKAYGPLNFDALVFTPSMLRIFPAKVDADDVITLNYDKTYGGTVDEQRMTPVSATVTMFDDAGNQVGQPLTISAKKVDETIWSAAIIPTRSFTASAGRKLAKFKYKFNGTVLGTTGASQNASSSETEVTFTSLK
ncbi:hypothetical protein ACTJIJ_09110 [Niabella sp. 22666]|uniref:hypothetical protein n=1 Tax=Niabella sp. 22666 TaxID=3453954 RepID=UPI003F838DDB